MKTGDLSDSFESWTLTLVPNFVERYSVAQLSLSISLRTSWKNIIWNHDINNTIFTKKFLKRYDAQNILAKCSNHLTFFYDVAFTYEEIDYFRII